MLSGKYTNTYLARYYLSNNFDFTKKISTFYNSLDDIADLLLDQCVNNNIITNDKRKPIKDAIMRKKTHQFEAGNGGISRKDSLMKSIVDHNFLPTSSSKSKKLKKNLKLRMRFNLLESHLKMDDAAFLKTYIQDV